MTPLIAYLHAVAVAVRIGCRLGQDDSLSIMDHRLASGEYLALGKVRVKS